MVLVGTEEGTLWLYYLHDSSPVGLSRTGGVGPRSHSTPSLTLLQVEKPHESSLTLISSSGNLAGKKTAKIATVGADFKVFVFALVLVKRLTRLEPLGFYEVDFLPKRLTLTEVGHSLFTGWLGLEIFSSFILILLNNRFKELSL